MSALPPKADICSATRYVCFVPIARASAGYSITSSARESRAGEHGEAERLSGFEIDHELELGRLLHRQVGGLSAPENFVNVAGPRAETSQQDLPHRTSARRPSHIP